MPLTSDQRTYHFLRRTGFGPSWQEFLEYRELSLFEAVDRRLNDTGIQETLDPTGGVANFDPTVLDHQRLVWITKMAYSAKQLREKMTFFWHNHFATANSDVKDVALMVNQNGFLRQNALSDFRTLLVGIAKDPAMMLMLDTQQNSKRAPNENFAREVMELFTLGQGNGYTEQDIKEAARTFCGWRFDKTTLAFYVDPKQADTGTKTIFGQSGAFTGEDFLGMLLQSPYTGPFLAAKLFRFFVSDVPDQPTIDAVAKTYYDSGYSISAMLRTLFLSSAFIADTAYRAQIKNPLEFLIGIVKLLGLSPVPFVLPSMLRTLNLDLYNPPSVKGWPSGADWIGTTALMTRANQSNQLVSTKGTDGKYYFNASAFANATGQTTIDALIGDLLGRFADGDVTSQVVTALLNYYGQKGTKATAPGLSGHTLFLPAAMRGTDSDTLPASPGVFSPQLPPSTVWTNQEMKMRGLVYLILSSPSFQLN